MTPGIFVVADLQQVITDDIALPSFFWLNASTKLAGDCCC